VCVCVCVCVLSVSVSVFVALICTFIPLLTRCQTGHERPLNAPSCATVAANLFSGAQTLQRLLSGLRTAHEAYAVTESSVRQRLGWAASSGRQFAGAAGTVSASVPRRAAAMATFARACTTLSALANTLAHFETYRPVASGAVRFRSDDQKEMDAMLCTAISELQHYLVGLQNTAAERAQVESQLPRALTALAPDGRVTGQWIQSRMESIPLLLAGAHSEQMTHEHAARVRCATLSETAAAIRALQGMVGLLVADLNALLSPLVLAGSRSARAAADAHRDFEKAVDAMALDCDMLQRQVTGPPGVVYTPLVDEHADPVALANALFAAISALQMEDSTQDEVLLPEKAAPRAAQERNTQAAAVWRRVHAKLDGRDGDHGRRSVAEQWDALVSEATSEARLAHMYEGWAPWV
jgi:hypothetical protein